MRYQTPLLFPDKHSHNIVIAVNQSNKPFNILATSTLVDLHFNGDAQCLPLYRYDEQDKHHGLGLAAVSGTLQNPTPASPQRGRAFPLPFGEGSEERFIEKLDIFHYTYAVLHHPAYRAKYELSLKREFPRLPLYADFWLWVQWGRQLMELHLNYESMEPYPLERRDQERQSLALAAKAEFSHSSTLKAKFKADKLKNAIILDTATSLHGVPPLAWEYTLGNRSALEWILYQYKEKTPKDPTIREKFNTYRFADYKEQVIDLLLRVCTVSVKTVQIIRQMEDSTATEDE